MDENPICRPDLESLLTNSWLTREVISNLKVQSDSNSEFSANKNASATTKDISSENIPSSQSSNTVSKYFKFLL